MAVVNRKTIPATPAPIRPTRPDKFFRVPATAVGGYVVLLRLRDGETVAITAHAGEVLVAPTGGDFFDVGDRLATWPDGQMVAWPDGAGLLWP